MSVYEAVKLYGVHKPTQRCGVLMPSEEEEIAEIFSQSGDLAQQRQRSMSMLLVSSANKRSM